MVLGQVADEGLVNEKTKRTVRVLMARGLVCRQPHFTLMNETFRQFVLSPQMQSEVDALEEQSSGAWDVMRWPFLIILIASLGFFFATQQELFNTVLGALTAAAALVQAIVKMATSFGERRRPLESPQRVVPDQQQQPLNRNDVGTQNSQSSQKNSSISSQRVLRFLQFVSRFVTRSSVLPCDQKPNRT